MAELEISKLITEEINNISKFSDELYDIDIIFFSRVIKNNIEYCHVGLSQGIKNIEPGHTLIKVIPYEANVAFKIFKNKFRSIDLYDENNLFKFKNVDQFKDLTIHLQAVEESVCKNIKIKELTDRINSLESEHKSRLEKLEEQMNRHKRDYLI
jgi:hypothetical protein